jgi:uncharacterized membrane protein YjfL (UPF0719 family)
LVFAIVFLLVGKKLFDLLTPYSVNTQLTEKDNPAVGILVVGFLLGITAVMCGVFIGEGPEVPSVEAFLDEIGPVAVYGFIGMFLLFIAGIVNDKIVLRKFSNQKEIIEFHNPAVAVIMAATYIGSGLIIAGGIRGSINIVSMLISFGVAQIALTIFAILYQIATKYDDQEEIGENKNLAAGFAFSGNIIAYSLILMKGVSMRTDMLEEWGWADRLLNVGYYAVAGLVLLIITRIINDRLFLPKAKISKEIVEDRNINAGLMEAGIALAMGSAMVFCL